jgi:hypothetical protein
MWCSNPTWGSPRIVGELRKLGINVAKSTVEKYRPKVFKPSSPTWKAFLHNHVNDLVSCDFFTVPTVNSGQHSRSWKPFRGTLRHAISSGIGMPSTGHLSNSESRIWASTK